MADIGQIDDLEKLDQVMRLELEISRIEMSSKELNYKLFSLEKEKKRIQESLSISEQTLQKKRTELEELKRRM